MRESSVGDGEIVRDTLEVGDAPARWRCDVALHRLCKRCLGPLALCVFLTVAAGTWFLSGSAASFRLWLNETLLEDLIREVPVPSGESVDAAYILGGTQESLEYKYRTVAGLVTSGTVRKVWFLGRPGITGYSAALGRNLTNDEWSVRTLGGLGVAREQTEIVEMVEDFFGTLSEAKQVSGLVASRSVKSIVLVAQKFHTRRALASFKKYMPAGVKLYISSSEDTQRLYESCIEFIKWKVYEIFLLR